jgi:hypothetical protein
MQHPRSLKIISRMNRLISIQCTGKPAQFAFKLNISERSLFNYLAWMKSSGAPIKYSKCKESYIYTMEGSFVVGFYQSTHESHAA